jgi:hypothetical protein
VEPAAVHVVNRLGDVRVDLGKPPLQLVTVPNHGIDRGDPNLLADAIRWAPSISTRFDETVIG